ncbi:MAG: TRAP transporter large permease [Clostridiales bacterium]|nr:TRAP transporter large permease [Clostridiales bacterium]
MDTNTLATIVLLGGFVVLLMLRVPVSFSLIIATVCSALVAGEKLTLLMRNMVLGVNNFSLLSIPFFILAGEIMGTGGISKRLIDFSNLCVGWMRGGLAMVNILASMLFGGISGSAVADVSSLGTVLIPMMKKQGYDDDFSVGITVTSACQGVLIPPSHNMVIFALVCSAPVSIGGLFMGGMIPGILLGLALMVLSYFLAIRRKYPKGDPIPRGQKLKVVLNAILPLFTIVIIIGGVTLGIFTATESAAIACLYAFIVTFFIIREVKLRVMGKVLKNTLKTLAIVLTLIAAAKAFAIMMTTLRIPETITAALIGITSNKYLLLLIINALLLFLGCIMDMAPLILIMTPILEPVIVGTLGMDPIHFGVMMIFNLAIGLCTPPVGSALFVGCAIGRTPIERTSIHMMPMYAVMVVMLFVITFVPQIVMWVPNMIG